MISGNKVIGIEIAGGMASGNLVQANSIGTNKARTAAIANGADGIFINNAPANTIGGATTDAGNFVSGNSQIGIQLFGLGAQRNLVQNNTLGRNASGGISPGLLNGDSGDLGIYVNTTAGINTIAGNFGQGLRESPTGAPFIPADPGSASSGASARVLHRNKHARPFAHRRWLKATRRPADRQGHTSKSHIVDRFNHR